MGGYAATAVCLCRMGVPVRYKGVGYESASWLAPNARIHRGYGSCEVLKERQNPPHPCVDY